MDKLNLRIEVETDREVKEHIEALANYTNTMQEYIDYLWKDNKGLLEKLKLQDKIKNVSIELDDSLKNLLAKHSTIEIVGTKNQENY